MTPSTITCLPTYFAASAGAMTGIGAGAGAGARSGRAAISRASMGTSRAAILPGTGAEIRPASGVGSVTPQTRRRSAPGRTITMKRLWKILWITLVGLAVVVLLAAALGYVWARKQLRPQDVTAARAKWPRAMTYEAADRAALDLVSK